MDEFVAGFLGAFGGTVSDLLGGAVLWLIDLLLMALPMSPFLTLNLSGLPSEALGWANWFIDFNGMLGFMGLWLAAVSIYMILSTVIQALQSSSDIRRLIGDVVMPLTGLGD